jgi:hypothetical protein
MRPHPDADSECPECKGTGYIVERTVTRADGTEKPLANSCWCVLEAALADYLKG